MKFLFSLILAILSFVSLYAADSDYDLYDNHYIKVTTNVEPQVDMFPAIIPDKKKKKVAIREANHRILICIKETTQCEQIHSWVTEAGLLLNGRLSSNESKKSIKYFSFSSLRRKIRSLDSARLMSYGDLMSSPKVLLENFRFKVESNFKDVTETESVDKIKLDKSNSFTLKQRLIENYKNRFGFGVDYQINFKIKRFDGQDKTEEFQQNFKSKSFSYQNLEDYHVLFATGMNGQKAILFEGRGYFNEAMDYLQDQKVVSYSRYVVPTIGSMEKYTKKFKKHLKKLRKKIGENKPILLVGQSLSNNIFANLLIESTSKEIKAFNIKGWVAINSSFRGNPTQEDTYRGKKLLPRFVNLIGGQGASSEMYKINRDEYIKRNEKELKEKMKLIGRTISVTSRIAKRRFVTPMYDRHRYLLTERGIENDGSSGTYSHIIPSSDYVMLDNTDHAVFSNFTTLDFDSKKAYDALFQMITK